MQTIHTRQEAGPDKVLRFAIPVDQANQRYIVTVTVQPEPQMGNLPEDFLNNIVGKWEGEWPESAETDEERTEESKNEPVSKRSWPTGFLDHVFGCLKDVPFDRGDQGEYEQREKFP